MFKFDNSANTFSITSYAKLINPVYSEVEFLLDSSVADYMELDLYIGDSSKGKFDGDLRTLRILGDNEIVDIQGIVQPFFSSDASSILEIKRVDIVAKNFIGTSESSIYASNYYFFNAIDKGNFQDYNYILDGSINADFLNRWNAPITIHDDDKDLYLYFFHGIFESSIGRYDVSTVSLEVMNDNVLSSGYKTSNSSVPTIYELNICPSSLNTLITDLNINGSTIEYSINPSLNTTNVYKKTVKIADKDNRFDYNRVKWVDHYGCINTFNFDLIKNNNIEIEKEIYLNNRVLKQFGNKVRDIYTITSNWITEEESLAMKDLWYSPSVMINNNYAIILNKNQQIQTRRGIKLINYTIEYEPTNEYRVQIQ